MQWGRFPVSEFSIDYIVHLCSCPANLLSYPEYCQFFAVSYAVEGKNAHFIFYLIYTLAKGCRWEKAMWPIFENNFPLKPGNLCSIREAFNFWNICLKKLKTRFSPWYGWNNSVLKFSADASSHFLTCAFVSVIKKLAWKSFGLTLLELSLEYSEFFHEQVWLNRSVKKSPLHYYTCNALSCLELRLVCMAFILFNVSSKCFGRLAKWN